MRISRVWEILGKFKIFCRCQGWKTSESEDWIKVDDRYHNFVWARGVSPSSFRRIASDRKCVVREGLSYSVVAATCTAWLFSETPPECLVDTIRDNPDFSKTIALYDLSQVVEGKNLCMKLNNTNSPVFEEFEGFLRNELKVKVATLPLISGLDVNATTYNETAIA